MAEKRKKSRAVVIREASVAALQVLDFHDTQISTGKDERTGHVYCVPKEICEHLGVSWSSQLAKLKGDAYSPSLRHVAIATPSGVQTTTLLDVEMLPSWLLSIQSERIKAEYRERLLAFQNECAKALHAYWTKGVAVNPRTQGDILVEMALGFREQERRIERLEAEREALYIEQLRQHELLITQQAQLIQTIQALQQTDTKADLAIEATAYMTIEECILRNGLLHQCPPSAWRNMARWLTQFCQERGLPIHKTPVFGKPWPDENCYPVSAIKVYLDHYLQRGGQMPLVEEEGGVYATPDAAWHTDS